MSRAARVSVLLPVRDGEPWLAEALRSVCDQTFEDFEVIVVDDGSRDGTGELLRAWPDPRLRVLRNEPGQGLVPSLNRALEASSAELVARMDADDRCRPGRLAAQVAFLDAHPDVGVVGGAVQHVDAAGAPLGPPVTSLPVRPAHIAWLLWWHNVVNHPTVLARRALLAALGGYRAASFPAEDYDLWLRARSRAGVANLPEVVLDYRVHAESITGTRGAAAERAALKIAAAAQSEALGRPIRPAAIQAVRQPATLRRPDADPPAALEALDAMRDLTTRWARDAGGQPADVRLVEEDAADRAAAMVLACLPHAPLWAWRLARNRAGLLRRRLARALALRILRRLGRARVARLARRGGAGVPPSP